MKIDDTYHILVALPITIKGPANESTTIADDLVQRFESVQDTRFEKYFVASHADGTVVLVLLIIGGLANIVVIADILFQYTKSRRQSSKDLDSAVSLGFEYTVSEITPDGHIKIEKLSSRRHLFLDDLEEASKEEFTKAVQSKAVSVNRTLPGDEQAES